MATVYRTALIVALRAEGRSDLAVLELHSIARANCVGSARSNRQSVVHGKDCPCWCSSSLPCGARPSCPPSHQERAGSPGRFDAPGLTGVAPERRALAQAEELQHLVLF